MTSEEDSFDYGDEEEEEVASDLRNSFKNIRRGGSTSLSTGWLEEDEDMDAGDAFPTSNQEPPWNFMTYEELVNDIRKRAFDQVGYVFAESDIASWKCLQLLSSLEWNVGKLETVADDPEGYCKKAGVLCGEEVPKDLPEYFECTVCDETKKISETAALECQHRFCKECWVDSISTTLNSHTYQQMSSHLKCMERDCGLAILGSFVQDVAPKEFQTYARNLVKSYMEVNRTSFSMCPTCNKISQANVLSQVSTKTVVCECGARYCFGCTMAPHVPASCLDVERWKAKDADDEASLNLIKATTAICPGCGRALELPMLVITLLAVARINFVLCAGKGGARAATTAVLNFRRQSKEKKRKPALD